MSGPTTRAAGRRLSKVFARYPARTVDGCSCCVSDEDKAALANGSVDALQRYAHKALTTWGDDRDFRHHLPSLLQVLGTPALDDVAVKLRYAQWWSWPVEERDAVRAYLLAVWQDSVQSGGRGAARVLAAVLVAGVGLTEVLDPLRDEAPAVAAPVLAELVHEELYEPSGNPALVAWLRDRRTAVALQEAFFAEHEEERATRYSRAVDEIDWLPRE
jgi:hypothetical protein